jgi:hypothetical protein
LSVQLVVLDNLTTVKGSADENSAAMGKVMGHFRQLAEASSAAVILIHHQRKVAHQGKGGDASVRAGDRLRGHSSIEAAVDLALLVERQPHADTVTLEGTKVRGVGVPPFGAQFSIEKLEHQGKLHVTVGEHGAKLYDLGRRVGGRA